MLLYDCAAAPNGRRVNIFLAEKGIEIPKVEINIIAGENLSPEYLAKNPRGVLPLLEMDDGSFLDESVAICRYFEEIHPEPPLMGTDPASKALIESRQRHIEFDGLLPLADIFRNSAPGFEQRAIPGTSDVTAIKALVPRGFNSFNRFLERLNATLEESQYIAGEQFSIADITALCAIDFAKLAKISVPRQHIHTTRWYDLVSRRPSTSIST
jgi:glutathione S-transferase